jgi:hypothetical protein
LHELVYSSLILQTHFKPLLDSINLVVDRSSDVYMDFSNLHSALEDRINEGAALGMQYLIEPVTT